MPSIPPSIDIIRTITKRIKEKKVKALPPIINITMEFIEKMMIPIMIPQRYPFSPIFLETYLEPTIPPKPIARDDNGNAILADKSHKVSIKANSNIQIIADNNDIIVPYKKTFGFDIWLETENFLLKKSLPENQISKSYSQKVILIHYFFFASAAASRAVTFVWIAVFKSLIFEWSAGDSSTTESSFIETTRPQIPPIDIISSPT